MIREALQLSKKCLDNGSVDLGSIEYSFKKVDMANTKIVQQGYSGIWVDTLEFYSNEGELVHIDDTRTAVYNAQRHYINKKGENESREA